MNREKFIDNLQLFLDTVTRDIYDIQDVGNNEYDFFFPNANTSNISINKGREFIKKLDKLEINKKDFKAYFWNLEPFGIEDREDIGIILTIEVKSNNISEQKFIQYCYEIEQLINKYYDLCYKFNV